MKSIVALVAFGALTLAVPASAESLLFQLHGPTFAIFSLDSNPVPDRVGSNMTGFDNVGGLFGNFAGIGSVRFGVVAEDLSAEAFAFTTPQGNFGFLGDQIFSGSLDSPVFVPGSYVMTDMSVGGLAILTISGSDGGMPSTIPEPATWALLGVGFGLVGISVRRQRRLIPAR